MIVPSSVLGLGNRPAPSNRINVACIGFGTIAHNTGRAFLSNDRVQMVAVADVNRKSGLYGYQGELEGGRLVGMQIANEHYANANGRIRYRGCRAYEDFRVMLENEDIDAVNISTPDHWHGPMSIYCANRKKHIYGQKPLSLTVEEGRAMVKAVKRNRVTWQTGSQLRSDPYAREAVEFVRNERIGKLKTVRVGLPSGHSNWNQSAHLTEPAPIPIGLNYELWQGPVPHRDYRPALLPLNWRHNYDYSGGMVTDIGAHQIDLAQWAMDRDASGPVRIENIEATLPSTDAVYNTATHYRFDCVYENGVRMEVGDNTRFESGLTFYGDEGKSLFLGGGTVRTDPPELRRERIQDDEIRVYKSTNHIENFLDCVESGKATVAPIEAAHRTISICHLANIAIRLGRKSLDWDPRRERIVGDREASAMLGRESRAGWEL